MSALAIDERLEAGFGTLAFSWNELKVFIEHTVVFSQDAIHVVAGVVIFLAAALLLRKPVTSIWPWLIVLLLASLNEFGDLWIEQWPERSRQYGESARDMILTMAVPTLIAISARLAPHLYRPPPR